MSSNHEKDLTNKSYETVRPDYRHSLVNLTSSIQKFFDTSPNYETLKVVDNELIGAEKVILLVLDGMGKAILAHHLNENSFLRTHLVKDISAVFPPTTVASTTSLLSGLLPGETGWIGWQQYFNNPDRHIVLFQKKDYYSNELVEDDYQSTIAFKPISDTFKKAKVYELYPAFRPDGFATFNEMANELIKITNQEQRSYTYAYWDNPDYLMHDHGCYHEIIKEFLQTTDDELKKAAQKLGPKTCLIITADHGLIDTIDIDLNNYPDLIKYFTKKPALETRCTTFFVNDKLNFSQLFNQYFSEYFYLYDKDTFLSSNLIGPTFDKAKDFIGDFVAIAKDKYCLTLQKGYFLAGHAGITTDEMIVPLIIYKNY